MMKTHLPTAICIAVILATAWFVAYVVVPDAKEARRLDAAAITARTAYPDGWLYTVTHDGHRFVVTGSSAIVHHPDCSCQR